MDNKEESKKNKLIWFTSAIFFERFTSVKCDNYGKKSLFIYVTEWYSHKIKC